MQSARQLCQDIQARIVGEPVDEDDARARGAATAARRPHLEDVATHVGLSPPPSPWYSATPPARAHRPAAGSSRRPEARLPARPHGQSPRSPAQPSSRRAPRGAQQLPRRVVEDLQAASEHAGYELVLSTVTRTRDERRAVETLLDFRCEALILLGPDAPPARLAVLGRQLPVIAVGRRVAADGIDVVRTATTRASPRPWATSPGLESGHRLHRRRNRVMPGDCRAATARRCAGMGWLTASTSSPETIPRSRACAPPPHCLASLSFPRRCDVQRSLCHGAP